MVSAARHVTHRSTVSFLSLLSANPAFSLVLLLLGVGGPLAFAAATPVFSTGDETAHVDYAYQIWHGRLPVFEAGMTFDVGVGTRPPVQWASQHPPLFYLLLAPVVGPLIDAGHPTMAGLAGRGLVVLIATATICASAWMAKEFLPAAPRFQVVVPAVLASSVWFMRLGGAVYNDMLMLFFLVLTLAATASIVRRGPSRASVARLAVFASGAALCRLSAVPIVFACLCVVAASVLVRSGARRPAWIAAPVIPGVAVLLTSGWFYARNASLTGSVTGGHPEWSQENLGRVEKPVLDVLTSEGFWRISSRQFTYSPGWVDSATPWLFYLPVVLGTVGALVVLLSRAFRQVPVSHDMFLLLLLVCSLVGISLMQTIYTAGGGAINGRYFIASLPQMSLLVALGLAGFRRATVPLVAAWLCARAVDLRLDLVSVLEKEYSLDQAATHPTLVWWGFGIFLAGVVGAVALLVWRPGNLAAATVSEPSDGDLRGRLVARGHTSETVEAEVPGSSEN